MNEFLVPTGRIVKEYLESREISQKELANRVSVSEKHISNLLNGKVRLSEEMALKLELVMPDVKAGYWLNYEAKYQEYLARKKLLTDLGSLDLKSYAKRFHFREVFKGLRLSLEEQAIEMLKLFGVSSFENYRNAIVAEGLEFMQDGGEPEAVVIWLKLCEKRVEVQNPEIKNVKFSREKLERNIQHIKEIALNTNLDESLCTARNLLNQLGIYLVVEPAIRNCKVRGALTNYNGQPCIYLSKRFKYHDQVWFAMFHEVAHLICHYKQRTTVVSYDTLRSEDDKDKEANKVARGLLVNINDYDNFVKKSDFSSSAIRFFAKEQGVDPGAIVGFLQHDRIIKFSQLNSLRHS